jgi:FkbM family methyltransferase
MKFKNLSSNEEANKWVASSIAESESSYFMPKSYLLGSVAVDIGANVGGFCANAHNWFDTIYAFEPLRENYLVLEQVLKQLNISNVEIYNNAIYSESNKELILKNNKSNISGDVTCIQTEELCDIHRDDFVDLEQKCETISLDDVFNRLEIDVIDYLKMDCEGSEYEILENFSDFDKIYLMVIEIHGYYGEKRKTDLLRMLSEHFYMHVVTEDDNGPVDMIDMIKGAQENFNIGETKNIENYFCINKKAYQPLLDEDATHHISGNFWRSSP